MKDMPEGLSVTLEITNNKLVVNEGIDLKALEKTMSHADLTKLRQKLSNMEKVNAED